MGTTIRGAQGVGFSPSKGTCGGELMSGTLQHPPHGLMLPDDKQIQTGFDLQTS